VRAIVQERWGTDPDAVLRLVDVEGPAAGPGTVLVHVAAASVDQGTVHCMTGLPYLMRLMGFGLRRPKASNPGRALAGTVASVGDAATGFAAGDEVYGTCAGSFVEDALVEPGMLARKPANLSFEQAAAIPISGVAGLQAVDKVALASGDHVLVIGASGGVGTFTVQIAKSRGAEVTGVCGPGSVELVRSLGADHVVDYTSADPLDGRVRYDAIVDLAGNRPLSTLRGGLTERGRLVIVGGETGGRWLGGFDRSLRAALLSPFVRQELGFLASKEGSPSLDALRDLIEAGMVAPAIDRTYELAETATAIRTVQSGHARGKTVIRVRRSPAEHPMSTGPAGAAAR
jgi:NADPH:quinone reductase-like Zn-dependent oxidoreductase